MTQTEAWKIISRNLHELYDRRNAEGKKPYSDEEIEAEVICFVALNDKKIFNSIEKMEE